MPLPAASFTGREHELALLDDVLTGDHLAILAQTITGAGGVGKTELAARYAQQHAAEYDIVAWVRAEDRGTADLSELAAQLGIDIAQLSPAERAGRALAWLAVSDERWLLVLDNIESAEDLSGCCPSSGNGRVIITTRDRSMAQYADAVAVDVFPETTAIEYLLARAKRASDVDGAKRVASALGYLPLALAHAGAYCEKGTSFDAYLALLDELPAAELFDSHPERSYARTVASTWRVSIAAAEQQAKLAGRVLTMAAYLAPEAIARDLFDVLLEDARDATQRKALLDAFMALDRFSLADVDDDNVSVHRLLQKTIRDDAAAAGAASAAAHAVRALVAAFPGRPDVPAQWPEAERLLPHVLAIADPAAPTHAVGSALVQLLNRAALYVCWADPSARAVATASTARARAQAILGDEHPHTLTARSILAGSYWSAGRTAEAIALQERVVGDSERILGDEHPSTLMVRTNLASSYRSAGRTTEAIALHERVLGDSERILGDEHPDTLTARANLASSYRSAGRTAEVIGLQERVLSDSERILGDEHPDTLMARTNLASSYRSAGRTAEAIALHERVLGDSERILGDEHPSTLMVRTNLASSYGSAGRTAEAIALQERVLSHRERILGDEHPDTLTARANLASSYWSAGRTAQAIGLRERVLAIRSGSSATSTPTR